MMTTESACRKPADTREYTSGRYTAAAPNRFGERDVVDPRGVRVGRIHANGSVTVTDPSCPDAQSIRDACAEIWKMIAERR